MSPSVFHVMCCKMIFKVDETTDKKKKYVFLRSTATCIIIYFKKWIKKMKNSINLFES